MNYFKKIFTAIVSLLLFFVFSPVAFAALACIGTTSSTANIQSMGGSGFCVGSSFLYRNGSLIGSIGCSSTYFDAGLAPATTYSYTSSYGGTSCTTNANTGTVRIIPNIVSAPWTITGPGTNQSGTGSLNLMNKNTGVYSIAWGNVAGYTKTITTQSLTLPASGGAVTFSNTYTPIPVITVPSVSLPTVSSITASSAILGANVTSNGGAPITARGTCWGTTPPGTNCAPAGGTALGVFSHLRTGMPPGTTLYYRGYATNSAGTGYSSTASFNTSSTVTIPTLITLPPSDITTSSALLAGAFSSSGNAAITQTTICWGLTVGLTTNCINYGPVPSTAEFGGTHAGMPSGTTIYFRAYGTNSAGTGQSAPASFTTSGVPLTIDLTASAVPPTTAIAGNATTFSSTISNTGTGGTGTSFTSLFQFDNDADHITSVFASQNAPTSAISAGGTTNISTSYVFPSVGTWYVRACADLNTAFVGTITELPATNENNNCGAWRSVNVLPITGTLSASNCTILTGLSSCNSTVSWSITNPVPPNVVRQNGTTFSSSLSPSGSATRAISYSGPNTFTLHSNNGATLLATASPIASCVVGTSWDGSVCAVPSAFSCIGVTPPNATIYVGDDAGLVANTPKTYSATNTAIKCQFSCNTGSSWNGTSCVVPTCGDSMCNGVETLLTCPRDCKTKVMQF